MIGFKETELAMDGSAGDKVSNIDDYFGGNKKRKVEPIDEDVEVTGEASENQAKEEEPKSGNWDFLSNMFGLGGNKKKPATEADSSTDGSETPSAELNQPKSAPKSNDTNQEKKRSGASESAARSKSKPSIAEEDPVKALEKVANAPAEDKADLLTQIFSAGFGGNDDDTEPETVKAEETVVVDAEDGKAERPKKRRSRRGGRGRQKAEESVEDSVDVDVEADSVADDENFVEFEIEDLDKTPVDEDESDFRGRSRRRRRRGRGTNDREERDSKRPARGRVKDDVDRGDDRFDDEVDPRDIDPRDCGTEEDGRGSKSRTRRRRNKSGSRDREEVAAKSDDRPRSRKRDDDEPREKPRRRRGRGRDRDHEDGDREERVVAGDSNAPRKRKGRRRDWDREVDGDDTGGSDGGEKRSGRIPTWKDAVGGIIEHNIKSHSSSSRGRGRGRSRSGGGGGDDRGRGGRGGGGRGRGRGRNQ